MGDVFIDGVGQTVFGRDDRNLEVIIADAAERALADSNCKELPDHIVIGNYEYSGYVKQGSLDALVVEELRKRGIISEKTQVHNAEGGSASGARAVQDGYGYAKKGERVLVVSGEEMWGKRVDSSIITDVTSRVIHEDERKKYKLTMPILGALATTEYGDIYGFSEKQMREIFFQVLNANRAYGSENDYAFFKEQLLRSDYLNPEKNPIVARPLTRNDCGGNFNGAAAVYLVPKKYKTDIKLSGIESSSPSIRINGRETLASMRSTVDAAIALYKYTRRNPHEIDIVELHDAFASIPIITAEDLGLVERGMGADFVRYGRNKMGKTVLYNLSGGFLCKTHPIGASGTAQLVELVSQMRGTGQYAEMLDQDDQNDIKRGLWCSVSGLGFYNVVGMIEKTEYSSERKRLNRGSLPTHLKPRRKLIERYMGEQIVGIADLPSPVDDYSCIGVTRTREGLELGYIKDREQLGLGRIVDVKAGVIGGEEVPYFTPVSNPVRRRLEKILG